jgi:hypothetical protein
MIGMGVVVAEGTTDMMMIMIGLILAIGDLLAKDRIGLLMQRRGVQMRGPVLVIGGTMTVVGLVIAMSQSPGQSFMVNDLLVQVVTRETCMMGEPAEALTIERAKALALAEALTVAKCKCRSLTFRGLTFHTLTFRSLTFRSLISIVVHVGEADVMLVVDLISDSKRAFPSRWASLIRLAYRTVRGRVGFAFTEKLS